MTFFSMPLFCIIIFEKNKYACGISCLFSMYEAQHQSSPFFHQIVLSFLRISWKSRFSTFPLKTPDSSSAWQKPQQNERGKKQKTLSFGTRKSFHLCSESQMNSCSLHDSGTFSV